MAIAAAATSVASARRAAQKMTLWTLTVFGMIVGTSILASASPAMHLLASDTAVQASSVQRVDYTWNHHHYKHRSWDKNARRWHYY
jgi:hypothetical protein